MTSSFRLLLISALLFFSTISIAQTNEAGIGRYFKEHQTFHFDSEKLYQNAKKFPNDFFSYDFHLTEDYSWELELHHSQIFSDNYILTIGETRYSKQEIVDLPIVLKGLGQDNNDIIPTITVNDGFLYGLIETRSGRVYFEPLSTFDDSATDDEYIVYHEKDVIHFKGQFCAATDQQNRSKGINLKEDSNNQSGYRAGECKQVDYAIANDHLVYNDRGSNTASWNAGVTANVNTDYDDTFDDEIRFVITENYISTSIGQDLWISTADAGVLLDRFDTWANGYFSNTHDLGGLWSGLDLTYGGSSGTIGLAWSSPAPVCSNYQYHVLEDYGGSSSGYRNLVSHEIGHNFTLSHVNEAQNRIMSGSVTGTTSWSTATSIPAMNAHYPTRTCLTSCGGGPPPPQGDAPVAAFGANLLSECNPTQVQMIDQSTNDPTSWSWQFESGTPGSSSQQNPIVIFPGGGDYRVTLTATNEHGSDTKVLIMTLNVSPAPTANYTSSISGNTVNFNNTSTSATSYLWNFGDGNSSSATNPSHIYSSPGTYSVSLEAINDCGDDIITKSIIIADNVTAAFSASETSECKGESIQFNNQSVGNVTDYLWEFEGGSPATSTAENPIVTYNNSGTFNAKLTVSNSSDSDIENKTNYITINDDPNAAYTYAKDGYTVTFDNNTIGATAYLWNFGDGNTSSSANPTHTYSTFGNYIVTLTSSNNCGSDATSQTIVLEEFVTASFESNVQDGCQGQVVNFISTSTGGVTNYLWEFENGDPSTSTDPNPVVTYNSSGSFNASLTVSNSSSSDDEFKSNYIIITGTPNVNFNYSQNEYTFDFDNNTIGGLFYDWDFGDGNTSSAPNPTHTYTTPGTYTVTLVSENNCGSNELGREVTIDEIVEADFETSSTFACEGQSIDYASTSFGDIASYAWEFEGGTPSTSSDPNPTIIYNTSGVFNVKLTVEGIYGTTDVLEVSNHISVSEYADADFSYVLDGLTIDFSNFSTGYDNISWNFGDGTSSTMANPTHTYVNEGNYNVVLSVSNDCGTDQKEIEIPVFDQLLANFQASKTTICPGEEVQLQDLSFGNPTAWDWIIDGSTMITADEQNPMIAIMEPGTYTVELTVSNTTEEHSKVLNQYIEVMPLPEAQFSYVQDDLIFNFLNESESGLEYLWDFGDGNTSTLISPEHEYGEEGEYIVTLEVMNECQTVVTEINLSVYERLIAGFAANTEQICASNEVQYTDRSTGNATSWSWSFPGGSPSTSNEQNPVVSYGLAGNYDVSLIVNNESEQAEETKTDFLNVLEIPELSISKTIDEYIVNFNSATEEINEILWDFGDGETSNVANPTHEYAEEGFYEVSLIVTNSCGQETISTEVKIQAEITADIEASAFVICPGETVSFVTETSKNVITWEWKLLGANQELSNEQNPSVKYLASGVYNVELKITSLFDEKIITLENQIIVNDDPVADFEYEINKDSVRFFNTSAQGDSYFWIFDEFGSSEDLSPMFIFSEEKSYEVKLITTNNCSSDTIVKTIDLFEDADIYANFSVAQTSYCLGDTIQFLDLSSDNIVEWSWKFTGGFPETSSERNPKISYTSFGEYDVELTVSNGFNTRTFILEDYVQIIEKPMAQFDLVQNGNVIELSNNSEHVTKYLWTFGDGNSASGEMVNYTFASNGNFNVSLKVENSCGIDVAEEIVEVTVYPKAGFSLDIAQGCSPLEVNFENRSTENADDITWVLEGVENEIISDDNPNVLYSEPGNYGIMVIASNSYGADTVALSSLIEVYESSVIEVFHELSGLEVEFNAEISKYDSLIWDFGDGSSSQELNPKHIYENPGEYKVLIQAFLGDCITEETIDITALSTSVTDLGNVSQAHLFPNPSTGVFQIDLGQKVGIEKVRIIDQLGRQIFIESHEQNNQILKFNLGNNIPSGNYVVFIYSENQGPIMNKLVISR